ncbi:hypothetical protein [Wenjunlia tyrosinilytica]|uniref:Uncharacterized protein n=1 Tax=Wenjunlia tyrosinilytica TaxID=1544741 RepID=A0A918E0T9_9ACTN|nr:hypothetical protein [Wenjunlia tyrosinilytica]GGO94060.1 hypothetical protein GCM10012280_48020 [Wenjunlia tyrosinilytica]
MHGTDEGERAIDALLDQAEVLTRTFDDYDPQAARERAVLAADDPPGPRTRLAAPARSASEHEQAQHELALACALIINAPQAAEYLARLADRRYTEPEGALVFACLLQLSGRDDAAQFWWQFAAGGGSHTAAYCLYLNHRRYAEFRDARYWREQAALLSVRPARRAERPERRDSTLLPEDVCRDLLARCHQGLRPTLPPQLEAVIDRLHVDADDEDFGAIPRPSRHLAADLAARASEGAGSPRQRRLGRSATAGAAGYSSDETSG